MKSQIYLLENMECPECSEDIATEEITMDLFDDPFNGVNIECPDCKTRLSIDLRAVVTVLSTPDEDEED